MLMRAAPVLFVLMWSTGYIGSKLGADSAEPFTFLDIRFVLVLAILVPIALWRGTMLRSWAERRTAFISGVLIHGFYLGGVFWAIRHGMPAGIVALIVSTQPVVTAVLAGTLLGERIGWLHWAGLGLGMMGVGLVLAPKLDLAAHAALTGVTPATILAALVSLAAITAGTLYQKRSGQSLDLFGGAVWQYLGALAVCGPAAMLTETGHVTWSPRFAFALGWLVLVLSIGAISLLMLLIRKAAVSSVSSLMFLVPGVTAMIAFVIFDERLNLMQLVGLGLSMGAVLLISQASRVMGKA